MNTKPALQSMTILSDIGTLSVPIIFMLQLFGKATWIPAVDPTFAAINAIMGVLGIKGRMGADTKISGLL